MLADTIYPGFRLEDRHTSARAPVEFVDRNRLSRAQVAAFARLLRACWNHSP